MNPPNALPPHQLLNHQPDHPLFLNPFSIRLYMVEKQYMQQRLVAMLGPQLAQTILDSRAPFILPEVSLRPPIWTCTIFILF